MLERSSSRNNGLKLAVLHMIAGITRRFRPPGTDRFLRAIYNPDRRQTDHFSITMKYDTGLRIHIDSGSFLEWSLFFYGHYEPEITRVIKRSLRPGSVAVDVGANIGCHALVMGKLASEGGRVYAVEPQPTVFSRLSKNVELNRLSNVKALQCALSDAPGRLILHSFEETDPNKGKASFYATNVGERTVEIPVEVRTLDEVVQTEKLDRLDFMKIDTEGHEYKVLTGAKESIGRYRPCVVFEYDERTWKNAGGDFAETRRFFEELDYCLYVICAPSGNLAEIEDGLPTSIGILASPGGLASGLGDGPHER